MVTSFDPFRCSETAEKYFRDFLFHSSFSKLYEPAYFLTVCSIFFSLFRCTTSRCFLSPFTCVLLTPFVATWELVPGTRHKLSYYDEFVLRRTVASTRCFILELLLPSSQYRLKVTFFFRHKICFFFYLNRSANTDLFSVFYFTLSSSGLPSRSSLGS